MVITIALTCACKWFEREDLVWTVAENQYTWIVGMTMSLLFVMDVILTVFNLKARYYILHTVTNFVNVLLTAEGMIKTLFDPIGSGDGPPSLNGYAVIVALHIYHLMAFPLNFHDYLHHGLMIGVVGPITFSYAQGCIVDYCSFFISGLPGGIDYLLLSLVRNGVLHKHTEKRANAAINTWIRIPFTIIGGFIIFQFALYKTLSDAEVAMIVMVSGLVVWNATYYGRRVIENYGNIRERGATIHAS